MTAKLKVTISEDGVSLGGKKARRLNSCSCRSIYVCGEYVIKLELVRDYDECYYQCSTEWAKYREMSRGNKRHVARIYKYGQIKALDSRIDYIIQKYIKPKRGRRRNEHHNNAAKIFQKLGIGDPAARNWILDQNDQIKIVDLGLDRSSWDTFDPYSSDG